MVIRAVRHLVLFHTEIFEVREICKLCDPEIIRRDL